MCGIGGVVGSHEGFDLAAMQRALAHRGPDGEGAIEPHPAVWLCATRLALRDAGPRGAQPMQEGTLTVVYNGELYNTVALREQLGSLAPQSPRSDTALLLAAYRAWGEKLVERIEGMFAFALWDDDARVLLLGRDPLGVKPLFVAKKGQRVAFASEIRALLAGGVVPARLDRDAVDAYLATGSPSEPRAIIAGIDALPPGTTESIGLDGTRRRNRYWVGPRRATRDGRDAASQVAARLEEVVPQYLVGDSPVGLLLSDGVDSAALAIVAARTTKRLPSFHVHIDPAAAAVAAARARRFGFEHVEVSIEGRELERAGAEWLVAQDQPSIDGLNTWLVARAVRAAGVKAVLSGVGADELFVGYPYYRTAERIAALERPLALLHAPASLVAPIMARAQLSGVKLGWPAAKALEVLAGRTPPEVALRRLFPLAMRRAVFSTARDVADPHRELGHGAIAAATRDLSGYLVDTLLRDADVMGMAHGVELRVPFVDVRLVELVTSLPDSVRLGGGPKQLLLDAVPGLREIAPVAKRGFELPVERLLMDRSGDELRDLVNDRQLVDDCGLVPRAAKELVRRGSRSRPDAFRALAIGALLSWARRHGARL